MAEVSRQRFLAGSPSWRRSAAPTRAGTGSRGRRSRSRPRSGSRGRRSARPRGAQGRRRQRVGGHARRRRRAVDVRRLAPRHAAGRRRLRRRARRRLRARGGGRGARVGRRAAPAAGRRVVRRRGGRPLPHRLLRQPGDHGRGSTSTRRLRRWASAEAIHGVTRESLLESREQLAASTRSWRCTSSRARRSSTATWRSASPTCWRRGRASGPSSRASPTTPGRARWPAVATRWWRPPRSSLAVDEEARARPGAVATVGRVEVAPGSTNSIPGRVACPLDARAREAATVDELVADLRGRFPDATSPGSRETTGPRSTPACGGAACRRRAAGVAGRRSALLRRPRRRHPGAPRAGRDALRPQPHRREPHAGRVGLRRRLRRGGAGARRRARSAAHSRLSRACGESCGNRAKPVEAARGERTNLAHIATSWLWETRAPLDEPVWKG